MKVMKFAVIDNMESTMSYKVISPDADIMRMKKVIFPIFFIIEEMDEGIFLYRYDSVRHFLGDTLHTDFEEAEDQIEYEIGKREIKWNYIPQSSKNIIESAFEYFSTPPKYYSLKYMHDYFTYSLWSNNENANKKYGYSIDLMDLPISIGLLGQLDELASDFESMLNQEYPPDTIITPDFMEKSKQIYLKVKEELEEKYEVTDKTGY